MALKIAKDSAMTNLVSTDTSNPITTNHTTDGSTVSTKLYLFNDDATKKYSSISLGASDTTGVDESSWVQFAPDNAGTAGTYTATLTMADITDNAVAHPFWVKVTVPGGVAVQNKTDLRVNVTRTESAV